MKQSDLFKLAVLFLVSAACVQYAKYHIAIDSVEEVVARTFIVYHQHGAVRYEAALLDELELITGLIVDEVIVVEDSRHDELVVEVSFTLPLNFLWMETERFNQVKDSTVALGL